MAFAAITYNIKPGYEDEIAEIFSEKNFKRATGPQDPVNRIIGTGLFIKEDTMVRIIQYEGNIAAVGATMAGQEGVKEAELKLSPYLATPRDTSTPEGFANYFRNSIMELVFANIIENRPATMAALRYKIKPGAAEVLSEAFGGVTAEARPTLRGDDGEDTGSLVAVALFVKNDILIRVVQFDGEVDDVARYMAEREQRRGLEKMLEPYAVDQRDTSTPELFVKQFHQDNMRCISQLSIADRVTG